MKMDFSVRCSPLKMIVSRKVILLFHILAVDLIFGMGFVSFFKKIWVFSVTVPKKGNVTNETFSIGINFYVGLGLFQSLPCRYLQRTLLFLCLMQHHGFDDNCFHWTQIRFLSCHWGLGQAFCESSSSHQCVRILSCHLICSNCFYLQQIFFFVHCNYFLFAATTFYLQQLYLFCSNFLLAACPLWATVLSRGKRKSFRGKLHLWSNPVRKHLQKHKP